MTQLLTALLTLAAVLIVLGLAVAVPLLVLALTPRAVMRRRRQVARFTRKLATRLANQPTRYRDSP